MADYWVDSKVDHWADLLVVPSVDQKAESMAVQMGHCWAAPMVACLVDSTAASRAAATADPSAGY